MKRRQPTTAFDRQFCVREARIQQYINIHFEYDDRAFLDPECKCETILNTWSRLYCTCDKCRSHSTGFWRASIPYNCPRCGPVEKATVWHP
jgi:hypothetical protein